MQPIRWLRSANLFLFCLGQPDNAIARAGGYTHFSLVLVARARDALERRNGVANYETFRRPIARYKKLNSTPDESGNAVIY